MQVYYAHMRCVYGTPEERLQKKQIESAFPGARILDPSLFQSDKGMEHFIKLVKRCDTVVFSRVDGKIGAGVGKEANNALKDGKQVFELREDGSVARVTKPVAHLNIEETVVLLEQHGLKLSKEELEDLKNLPASERLSHRTS